MTTSRGPGALTSERTPIRRRRLRLPGDLAGRRVLGMTLVLTLVFGGVVARLVQVQVVRADEYAQRGEAQRARTIALPARRGRVLDREGDILAMSVDAATIYADPRAFRGTTTPDGTAVPPAGDPAEVAAALAPVIDGDAAAIEDLLRRDAHFVYLARQLDLEVGDRVEALGLPGIGVLTEPARVYPGGPLAGQIVGFTDIDGRGLLGLELQHDSLLGGRPGQLVLERAPGGLTIPGVRELVPPAAGTDVVLTIDREIQHVAARAAADVVDAFGAAGASIVVLEVATGDVLAMASAPSFDPHDRSGVDPALFRNRSVTDVYEPGSVQKALTAAAALEEGIVTPETTMLVHDRLKVGSKVFSDSHDHEPEEMSFTQIMEQSSNVGTIAVAQELGDERLASYLDAFGYGQRLGIGFPGESPGLVLPVDQWWQTSLPTIAIGQGVAVTLLQSTNAYATIANDGVAVTPRLVRGTIGEDGRLTPYDTSEGDRVISHTTAEQVQRMLGEVVSGRHGTGKAAAVAGYDVAGKTGTARKPRTDGRGYSGKYVASFVGFAPVDDPRIVVGVMVDEPYPIWGGVVAAPAFSEVMQFTLLHRRIAPTGGAHSLEAAFRSAAEASRAAAAEARREGPGTDDVTSPPVGTPAGGDGDPVGTASPSG